MDTVSQRAGQGGATRLVRQTFFQSRLVRAAIIAAVVVLSLGRIATYERHVEVKRRLGTDFVPDYVSAKEILAHGHPYAPLRPLYRKYFGSDESLALYPDPLQRNPHPPALVLVFLPLVALTAEDASLVFALLGIAATGLGIFLIAREAGANRIIALTIMLAGLATPVVEDNIRWAQTDGVILLAFVLAWRALRRDREGRAGILLGAVTAFKIFPWLMVIPLLRTGRKRAAFRMVITAVILSAVSVVAVGFAPTREFITEASPRNFNFWSRFSFASLVSTPVRWLAPEIQRDPSTPLPRRVLAWAVTAVALCGLTALLTRARATGDLYWAAMPLVFLASPLAWAHQLILLIPSAIVYATRRGSLRGAQRALVDSMFLFLILGFPLWQWMGDLAGQLAALSALIVLVIAEQWGPSRGVDRNQFALRPDSLRAEPGIA